MTKKNNGSRLPEKCPNCGEANLELNPGKGTKKKTIKKWLRKIDWKSSEEPGLFNDLILLRQADRAANKAKKGKPLITNHMESLMEVVHEIDIHEDPLAISDLNISGSDLIGIGYAPGPIFGECFRTLLEIVLSKPHLNERDALMDMARDFMEEQN